MEIFQRTIELQRYKRRYQDILETSQEEVEITTQVNKAIENISRGTCIWT